MDEDAKKKLMELIKSIDEQLDEALKKLEELKKLNGEEDDDNA